MAPLWDTVCLINYHPINKKTWMESLEKISKLITALYFLWCQKKKLWSIRILIVYLLKNLIVWHLIFHVWSKSKNWYAKSSAMKKLVLNKRNQRHDYYTYSRLNWCWQLKQQTFPTSCWHASKNIIAYFISTNDCLLTLSKFSMMKYVFVCSY